jgi:hypothetical protein
MAMPKKQNKKPRKPVVARTNTSSGAKKPTRDKKPATAPDVAAETAKAVAHDPRLPAVRTTIEKRDRHGAIRCKCAVEDGGIRYAGKAYSSLSGAAIAAAKDLGLKNKTQNGYIFWGLIKPPRPASDPIVGLERAWERYRERAEALVKERVTEENRSRVVASIGKHAQLIEKLRGSATLKGASAK